MYSEVGRILRLGGPKKNFRGGAFSPEIFWIFQTEILEFRGILVPENISRARLGEFRGYLLLLLLSWQGGAGLLGGPWPPWPPSKYLTDYKNRLIISMKEFGPFWSIKKSRKIKFSVENFNCCIFSTHFYLWNRPQITFNYWDILDKYCRK